ncbi:MAG: hypothetical protein ACXWBH_04595, partial [Candidatus Angelobacter sp.]
NIPDQGSSGKVFFNVGYCGHEYNSSGAFSVSVSSPVSPVESSGNYGGASGAALMAPAFP